MATVDDQDPPRRLRPSVSRDGILARRPARLAQWAWLVPLFLGAIYLLLVAINFQAIITSINEDSDAAIALVYGQLWGHGPAGGQVVLGDHPWYEELLLLRVMRSLPLHRQLWEAAPALWTLFGFAVLAATSRRIFGASAAAITATAAVCLGPFGRFDFFSWNTHSLLVLHAIVLASILTWSASRAGAWSWLRTVVLAAAVGLLSSFPTASDQLFVVSGLLPLVIAACVVAWRTGGPLGQRARLPIFALLLCGVAVGAAALLSAVMKHQGVVPTSFAVSFVTPDKLVAHLVLLIEGYAFLGGGDFFGLPLSFIGLTTFVSGMLVIAALVLILREVRDACLEALPVPPTTQSQAPQRLAFVSFWGAALVLTSLAYVVTSAAIDANTSRYLLAGYVALAALLPLIALRGQLWRIAITAGVSLFALAAIYQVARAPEIPLISPRANTANQLLRYAQREQVKYGYSTYWDAADLTWATYFKLQVFPVAECAAAHGLCAFHIAFSNWFIPRANTRSLLIVDPNEPLVTGVDPRLGPPLAATTIGAIRVYVFGYDIAARLNGH